MGNNKKPSNNADFLTLKLSANSLMGKQSVRTTFRLPMKAINLLSITAAQLGLKQKSLFDQLIEDSNILRHVAEEIQNIQPTDEIRYQKTYVISKSSLASLSKVAQEHHMSRDVLVEMSIKRLLPVIDDEQKKQEKRKIILSDLEAYLAHGKKLLQKSCRMLGKDDQISKRLADLVVLCHKSVAELDETVEKGKQMENLL